MKRAQIKGEDIAAITSENAEYFGRMFWFTIGKCEIPITKMEELYKKYNLDERYLPPRPREKDVFKIATKLMESEEDIDETTRYEYLVRSSSALRKYLVREIHRMEDGKKKGNLEYKIVGYWDYDDEMGILATLEASELKDIFDEKTKELRDKFNHLMEVYTDKQIRDELRRVIYAMPTISLRQSGGVYFVPENPRHISILEGFANILDEINSNYSKTIYTTELVYIPVITTEPNRKMLIKKYEVDAKEKLEKIFKSIKSLIDSDTTISVNTFQQYMNEIRNIRETKQKYEELLKTDMDTVEMQIEILNEHIEKLASKVSV